MVTTVSDLKTPGCETTLGELLRPSSRIVTAFWISMIEGPIGCAALTTNLVAKLIRFLPYLRAKIQGAILERRSARLP